MNPIQNLISQYFDTDGSPLDAGYLYFGSANQNPETNPVTVYWDSAGTQPAAQPIRTINGAPSRNGTPAVIYVSSDYSFTIRNRKGVLVATYSSFASAQVSAAMSPVVSAADLATARAAMGITAASIGAAPRATRIDVASVAGTVDLTANAPDSDDVQFTGALNVTGFTVAAGRVIRGRAAAGMTLVNGANLITQTGADIVCVPGATFMLRAIAANQVEVLNFVSPTPSAAVVGQHRNLVASASGSSANTTISADEIVVENAAGAYMTLRNFSRTIVTTNIGADGLDVSPLAANTWYARYAIAKPDGTQAAILSLSETGPTTMPSGYTYWAFTGYVRTDNTGNKYPLAFTQVDHDVTFDVAGNVTGMPLVSGGAAVGSTSTPTYVNSQIRATTSTNGIIPKKARVARMYLREQGGSSQSIVAPTGSYGAYNSATNPPPMIGGVASVATSVVSTMYDMPLRSDNVYYALGSVASYLYCAGYKL